MTFFGGWDFFNFFFTVHYNTLQYITIHYNTLQYITIHYNTVQYSTQYSTVQSHPTPKVGGVEKEMEKKSI